MLLFIGEVEVEVEVVSKVSGVFDVDAGTVVAVVATAELDEVVSISASVVRSAMLLNITFDGCSRGSYVSTVS